ncbi:DinB family protein [Siccirubricoccus deserti]|uniref:DinB family protein n=1 Tax=Siccirubricoccus deserti TaxID=2013562 RepID=A0A9X0QWL1_9PROT|nr:DinB family protein [Siccirubricoccus deserti]MBC4015314.1 DinB family protein [Siccirubricoccus deserti]
MGPRQEHVRMFAGYNRWANQRLYAAAARLTPAALAEDRGAFFGSLLGTLNHLLVTDRLWLARLEGESPRGTRLDAMPYGDFAALQTARQAEDERLIGYVAALDEARLAAPLTYATTSGAAQSQPLHQALAHLFNHQTHHRGQAHHLLGLVLGREGTPVLDLLAFQRVAAVAPQ